MPRIRRQVDHQGAQHSTKIGSFRCIACVRAPEKSSWTKGKAASAAMEVSMITAEKIDNRSPFTNFISSER